MLALVVVIVATDGIALLYMSRIMNAVYADLNNDELDFANPYYGLDTLYGSGQMKSSKIDPIQNIPRVVAQVFPDRPKELAPVGEHDLFNKVFRMVSPHKKHLSVSPASPTHPLPRCLPLTHIRMTLTGPHDRAGPRARLGDGGVLARHPPSGQRRPH